MLKNGLLLHDKEHLVVPEVDNIQKAIVQETHDRPFRAYPST